MTVGAEVLKYSDEPLHARVRLKKIGPPDQILADCAALHKSDKKAELWKKVFLVLAIVSGIGTFFFGFPALNSTPLPLILGILLTLTFGFLRWWFAGGDVDDRRLDVVRKVVGALAPDMAKKRSVNADVDFSGYHKTRPVADSVSWGSGVKAFEQTWLRISFSLLDGARLRIECSSKVKRKQKRKRKYTKIKDGIVDEVSIEVMAPKGKGFDPQKAERIKQHLASMRPPLIGLKVKPKGAELKFRTARATRLRGRGGWSSHNLTSLLDGDDVLRLVATSYRLLVSENV